MTRVGIGSRGCAIFLLMLSKKRVTVSLECLTYQMEGELTLGYPTISIRAKWCRPTTGPAVTGAGDLMVLCSEAGSMIPLLAKEGYADLFCFIDAPSSADVSTLNDPVGGRLNWKLFVVVISTGVEGVLLVVESCC